MSIANKFIFRFSKHIRMPDAFPFRWAQIAVKYDLKLSINFSVGMLIYSATNNSAY